MATLTWRNVAAPDFRGVQDSYRTAGMLLNNAAEGLNTTLDTFQGAQQDRDANAALTEMLQFTDPAEAQAALASGRLTQGRNLNARGIAALGDRVGTLLNQATTQENLANTRYTNTRGQQGDALLDAAQPDIARFLQAARNNDQTGMSNILSGSTALQALRPGQLSQILENSDRFSQNNQSRVAASLRLDESEFDFTNKKDSKADTDAATPWINRIQQNALSASDARTLMQEAARTLNPRALARVQAGVSGMFPGMYGPDAQGDILSMDPFGGAVPPGSGAAGTSSGNPYDTILGYGQFGTPSKPFTSMTGKEAIAFGRDVLIPATRGNAQLGLPADKGSSAMGAYQFTAGTLQDYMPKVLKDQGGLDAPLTPENQEKLAEAIFNDRKSGNLKATWASLPDSTPGAYKDKSWADVRKEIVQGEVGATLRSPSTTARGVNQATNMLAARASENVAGSPVISELNAARADVTSKANDIANRLSAKGGPLDGVNTAYLIDEINRISNQYGVVPAVAGVLLSNSATGASDAFLPKVGRDIAGIFNRSQRNAGNNVKVDTDRLRALEETISGPAADQGIATNAALMGNAEQLAAARNLYAQLVSEINRRESLGSDASAYRQRAAQVQNMLDAMTGIQASDPTLNPTYGRNQEEETPPSNRPSRRESGSIQAARADREKARQELQRVLSARPGATLGDAEVNAKRQAYMTAQRRLDELLRNAAG